jgi:hypothetical protein
MKTYIEYKEFVTPEEILVHYEGQVEEQAETGEGPSLEKAGFFKYVSELTKQGWRPIWATMRITHLVLEREVTVEENEN